MLPKGLKGSELRGRRRSAAGIPSVVPEGALGREVLAARRTPVGFSFVSQAGLGEAGRRRAGEPPGSSGWSQAAMMSQTLGRLRRRTASEPRAFRPSSAGRRPSVLTPGVVFGITFPLLPPRLPPLPEAAPKGLSCSPTSPSPLPSSAFASPLPAFVLPPGSDRTVLELLCRFLGGDSSSSVEASRFRASGPHGGSLVSVFASPPCC